MILAQQQSPERLVVSVVGLAEAGSKLQEFIKVLCLVLWGFKTPCSQT